MAPKRRTLMTEQLQTDRPVSRRLLLVVVIAALVIVIPTAQFAGRVGRDMGGDAAGYLGMGLAVVAVVALAAGVGYLLMIRRS
jgi:hypothetical protein